MKQQQLNKCMQEVISACKAINLPVSNHIAPEVLINKRAKSRFGACRKTAEGFTIELNELMMDTDQHHIKTILAHEIIHTCKGCQNHGKKWKLYVQQFNQAYGYNITTTSTYESMDLERPEKKQSNRYMIQCQKCGKIIYRQRKSKLVTHINRYRCTCGGVLKCYINNSK